MTVAVSLGLGAAVSYLKLAFHCRNSLSEACVWGKAWFPVTLPVETIVFGVIAFTGITLVLRLRARKRFVEREAHNGSKR
jgi:hypothetical protein